jgi:hypothetical protein
MAPPGLSRRARRGVIVGRRFECERITLGDERYERCVFVACQLVFDGRPVHLVDNAMEGCTWSFEGAAGATLEFVAGLCRDDPDLRANLARALGLAGPEEEASRAQGRRRAAPASRRPC